MNCLLFRDAIQHNVKHIVTCFPHDCDNTQIEQLNSFFGNMSSSKLKCQGMFLDTEIQSFSVLSFHNDPYCCPKQLPGAAQELGKAF